MPEHVFAQFQLGHIPSLEALRSIVCKQKYPMEFNAKYLSHRDGAPCCLGQKIKALSSIWLKI